MTTIRLVTAPTLDPFTLETAKDHARIDSDADDAYLRDVIIPAAVRSVELATGYRMMSQTYRLTMRAFPLSDTTPICVVGAPIASITTFTYTDTAGATVAMVAGTDYTLDSEATPAALWPYVDTSWPTARDVPNSIILDYVLGVADTADVQPMHKLAALELIDHWYANRAAVEVGQGIAVLPVPETIQRLLRTDRLFGF